MKTKDEISVNKPRLLTSFTTSGAKDDVDDDDDNTAVHLMAVSEGWRETGVLCNGALALDDQRELDTVCRLELAPAKMIYKLFHVYEMRCFVRHHNITLHNVLSLTPS